MLHFVRIYLVNKSRVMLGSYPAWATLNWYDKSQWIRKTKSVVWAALYFMCLFLNKSLTLTFPGSYPINVTTLVHLNIHTVLFCHVAIPSHSPYYSAIIVKALSWPIVDSTISETLLWVEYTYCDDANHKRWQSATCPNGLRDTLFPLPTTTLLFCAVSATAFVQHKTNRHPIEFPRVLYWYIHSVPILDGTHLFLSQPPPAAAVTIESHPNYLMLHSKGFRLTPKDTEQQQSDQMSRHWTMNSILSPPHPPHRVYVHYVLIRSSAPIQPVSGVGVLVMDSERCWHNIIFTKNKSDWYFISMDRISIGLWQ